MIGEISILLVFGLFFYSKTSSYMAKGFTFWENLFAPFSYYFYNLTNSSYFPGKSIELKTENFFLPPSFGINFLFSMFSTNFIRMQFFFKVINPVWKHFFIKRKKTRSIVLVVDLHWAFLNKKAMNSSTTSLFLISSGGQFFDFS